MDFYNRVSQKVKSLLVSGNKRKRENSDQDDDSESANNALEGLINISMELAKGHTSNQKTYTFKDVHPKDGWELVSYVYENDDDDISVTHHSVLGFLISNSGRVKVVSTITVLDTDPNSITVPCTNELWVLKNPNGIRYMIDGEHQGEVDDEDIKRELKRKIGARQ